jgi:3-dehydroquinate synthase
MKYFTVSAHKGDYTVFFDTGFTFFNSIKQKKGIWIVDRAVSRLYEELFDDIDPNDIIFVDVSEELKTLEGATMLYRQLEKKKMKRHTPLISVGGGITQDITGFVAATWYRGVPWFYVPTTLLAQADSCIGSKTSLNFDSFKNLLGTFYSPQEVFISTKFLDSLDPKDVYSGFGEIIKLQLIKAQEHGDFQTVTDKLNMGKQADGLLQLIYDSLLVKKEYIEEDEFDFGKRKLLNYGHCFGHALESVSAFTIPHGLAVVIGVLFANIIALKRKKISQEFFETLITEVLLPHIHMDVLEMQESFYGADALFQKMKKDKKRSGDGMALVLPKKDFKLELVQDISMEELQYGCRELEKVLL